MDGSEWPAGGASEAPEPMNVREPGAATAGRFQTGTEAVWTLPQYGALFGVATFTQQPSPVLPGIGSASAGAAAGLGAQCRVGVDREPFKLFRRE